MTDKHDIGKRTAVFIKKLNFFSSFTCPHNATNLTFDFQCQVIVWQQRTGVYTSSNKDRVGMIRGRGNYV